jgi:hypothetical protein
MSFNIELVPARLTPFDWAALGGNPTSSSNTNSVAVPLQNSNITGLQQTPVDNTITAADQANIFAVIGAAGLTSSLSGQFNLAASSNGFNVGAGTGVTSNGLAATGNSIYPSSHPLFPLTQTGGLVFPYTPIISENLGVRYDTTELTHTNEAVHAFKSTENVRLTISDCVWTAETFDQAIYALGVIHFFRSFTLMDFGRKGPGTGKPPSPMWFNAYGNFMYSQVPVLIERVDWSFPQDLDYVGVPNPGTDAYNNQTLSFSAGTSGLTLGASTNGFTWIPIKFVVNSISMVVQHSINYWTNEFTLDDFKAGNLVGIN